MATAYPSVYYSLASTIEVTPKTIKTEYGDGMQKIIPDGINYLLRSGTIEHDLITTEEATTIRNFIKANMGGQVVQIKNLMDDPSGATTMNVYLLGYSQVANGATFTLNVSYRETPQL
jgi:phage-related protein